MPSHPYPIVYTQTKRRAVGGAAIQITEEVPVLPTSHALLTLDCQVITSNQTDNPLTLLGGLSNISFLYRGANIW